MLHHILTKSKQHLPRGRPPVSRSERIFTLSQTRVRPKKKKLLYCPLPTDRKMRKNRVGFFFFMSDLGEEFAKICIQWPKKALVCAF